MKKLLKSFLVLALVLTASYGVAKSGAWFTDTEEVLGNTIDTGTIDLEVGESQDQTYHLEDLKPSQHGYIDVIVHNVGTNPLNLFKTLHNFIRDDGLVSEPECDAEGGHWEGYTGVEGNGVCTGRTSERKDLDNVINYDMRVELYPGDPSNTTKVWWETIYLDSDNVKMSNIDHVYLGMIPKGWYMKVMQSYHMPSTVGNRYQGDILTFDMTFDAEQLGMSGLVLENKEYVEGDLSHTLASDDIKGTFTYTVRDRKLVGTLTGKAPVASANYVLVAGADPYFGGKTLGSATSDGTGLITVSVDQDLNSNLINAKVWLVLASDWNEAGMTGWHASSYLFETGLMDYYDADIY